MGRLLIILVSLILLAVPALSQLTLSIVFRPRLVERDGKVQKFWLKIKADLERLEKEPLFPSPSFDHEAESILADHISWEGVETDSPAEQEAGELRKLFSRYPYWETVGGQARKLLADPDLKKLDSAWVGLLKTRDHWPIFSRPEVRGVLQEAMDRNGVQRIALYSTVPIPDYSDLRRWAALESLRRHDVWPLKEAARLAQTTPTLVGQMSAAEYLQLATQLCAQWNRTDCALPSTESVEAFKRVSWAWAAIGRSSFTKSLPDEALQLGRPQTGVCASAWEMGLGIVAYQDFLQPRWPLESDYSGELNRARDYHRHLLEVCHLPELSTQLEPTKSEARPFTFPYLRRVLGLELLTVAVPDMLRPYEKLK